MQTDDDNLLLALINSTPQTPSKLDSKMENKETENTPLKTENGENQSQKTISLGVRQPSFSSLSGSLIPKGKETPVDLSILQETEGDPVVVLSKPESLKMFQSNSIEEFIPSEEDPNNIDTSPADSPLAIKYRQPSFASLDSDNLMLKGDVEVKDNTLPILEDEQQSSMVQQLAATNAERWQKMGYDPTPMHRNCSYQAFNEKEKMQPKMESTSKSVADMPPLADNFHLSQTGTLFTSNHKLDLHLEMPEEDQNVDTIQEDEEGQEEQESDNNSDSRHLQENHANNEIINERKATPILKKNQKKQFAQTYSFKGQVRKSQQSTPHSSSRKQFSQTQTPKGKNNNNEEENPAQYEGLPEEFHLDLTECSREQGYDSEQGSSRIPERIKDLVDQKGIPKESITYLALCQQSIAGYRYRTFRKTIQELKELLNDSIHLGYIGETEYISSVIDSNIEEYNELNSMKDKETKQSLRKQLDEVKQEREEVVKEFDMEKMRYENEKDTRIQTITDEYNLDLDIIDDTWTSEKKQAEYSKPSARLVMMRKNAERLLKFKRFKDAATINNECKQLEKVESEAAGKKLEADYRAAVKKREEKLNNDIETTKQFFKKRVTDLERRKNLELRKYDNKITSLEEKIKQMPKESKPSKSKKKIVQIQNTSGMTAQSRGVSGAQSSSRKQPSDIAAGSEPLKLPQLKTLTRSRPSTSISKTRNRSSYT